jgi:hypothetical protein
MGIANAASEPVTKTFPDAAAGDICSISGPLFLEEGETANYLAIVQDAETEGFDEIDVDLNDFQGGDSDITSIDRTGDGTTESIPATDFLNDEDLVFNANTCGDTDDDLLEATIAANFSAIYSFLLAAVDRGESCSAAPPTFTPVACNLNAFPAHNDAPNDLNPGAPLHSWQDNDIDCGLVPVLGGVCNFSNTALQAAAQSLAVAVANGADLDDDCDEIAATAEDVFIATSGPGFTATTEYVAGQLEDFLVNNDDDCNGLPGTAVESGNDGSILIDVTCDDSGVFDLTFAVQDGGAASIEVVCGSDVETGEIFARPETVEINPSIANVAHSIVWIEVKGNNGEIPQPGTEVFWTTDRCAIETSAVNTEEEFEAALVGSAGIFNNLNALSPITAVAVEQSTFATTAPDGASRQQEEDNTFLVTANGAPFAERVVSAVILHCDPIHAPNVTPGPAVVTAYVERGDSDIDDDDTDANPTDNDDLVLRKTITVVGPPAANGVTVTAAPATLACGEKATISVDVKDSIGQPVSDHTWVEAVTNAGGVLAGTGAVAGQAGLVSPVSSTVAETFGGKVTFYLLTSTAHVGKYEVVVTTGGGGGVTGQLVNGGTTTNLLGGLFTTPPISVQVTVECTVPQAQAPAPAPQNPSGTAPNTGQGIRPPSTGDAGLVSNESNSWVAGAVVAVFAAIVVAGFSLKVAREK